jgi:hypothetical protein
MMRQAAINDKKIVISQWSMVIYNWLRRQQLVPCGSSCLFKPLLFQFGPRKNDN